MPATYCFARPTHTYLDFNAGRDFEREIVVKVNAPEVARGGAVRPPWSREHVAMGTNTDPYQWVEGRYKLMPGIWEAMRDTGTPSLDPHQVAAAAARHRADEGVPRRGFTANLSIPTLDEKAWRATEPHTPHPRARIEAVAELNRQGIPCGVLVAPLMPGINDDPKQVEEILELCGGGRRGERRRHRAAPARRGAGQSSWLAALLPADLVAALRAPLRARRLRDRGGAGADRLG